jgi:hypothetical protein
MRRIAGASTMDMIEYDKKKGIEQQLLGLIQTILIREHNLEGWVAEEMSQDLFFQLKNLIKDNVEDWNSRNPKTAKTSVKNTIRRIAASNLPVKIASEGISFQQAFEDMKASPGKTFEVLDGSLRTVRVVDGMIMVQDGPGHSFAPASSTPGTIESLLSSQFATVDWDSGSESDTFGERASLPEGEDLESPYEDGTEPDPFWG